MEVLDDEAGVEAEEDDDVGREEASSVVLVA